MTNMTKPSAGAGGIAYLVAVAAMIVWGLLRMIDMPNTTYVGYTTTPQNVVKQVQPGSPAESGDLRVGDRIESIGGISIEDTRGLNRAPRVLPGDIREIGIERDGQAMTIDLTYASPPGVQRATSWGTMVLGYFFLVMTFWARSMSRSRTGQLLAWLGLCFAFFFLGGPYLSSVTLRNLAGAVTLTAIFLGFALLLRFVLSFPKETTFLAKPSARMWIWAPAAILALMFIYVFLAEPDSTSSLNAILSLLSAVSLVGYFGASLVVLVRRYLATSAEARRRNGLSLMLWGALLSMIPFLFTSMLGLLAPMLVLPGQRFYFFSLALIPLSFSLAVVRRAHAQTGVEGPA